MEPKAILELCRDCAASIFDARPPNAQYAERVARLLFGTAATESRFTARRQVGYSWTDDAGAWGLWQCEGISVRNSLLKLRERPALALNCAHWLFEADDARGEFFAAADLRMTLRLIGNWDRAACLFARLHYLWFPAPVPEGVASQADYWKRYYNTLAGRGRTEKYIQDWNELARPHIR